MCSRDRAPSSIRGWSWPSSFKPPATSRRVTMHHPGRGLEVIGDGVEQRNRRRIHQVYVLDLDQRGHDQRTTEEANDDLAKLGRLRVAGKLLDLGGGGSRHVEHERDQREPWQQLRVRARRPRRAIAPARRQGGRHVRGRTAVAADRARPRTAFDASRPRRLRASTVKPSASARASASSRDLPLPVSPTSSISAAAASTSGFDGPAQLLEVVVAADEREPGSLRCALARLTSAARHRPRPRGATCP